MLHDDLVAVTSQDKSIILLLEVTPDLSLFKKINTGRLYRGVACGGKDGKLIVSCSADDGNPAKVDKIERNGEVSQAESIKLPPKTDPRFLCVVGNDVLVSDKESNSVLRVDWNAQIKARYTDNDLKSPRQLATDQDGNIYVATRGGRAVLMLQPGGKCRKLLDGNKHGIGNCSRGQSVAVTARNMVVVVWAARNDSCVVAGYNLNIAT
ncbi:hypothetical protein BaRGS_00038740 [Batillaria attramentaria]|uniref:SMP-30/Gluconolactonase/LRE-like region domain-containing protein n=1 Tax=Batillaria attramentaria TaxID=370345 RepID=A0ABD0J5U8_9CAEN